MKGFRNVSIFIVKSKEILCRSVYSRNYILNSIVEIINVIKMYTPVSICIFIHYIKLKIVFTDKKISGIIPTNVIPNIIVWKGFENIIIIILVFVVIV